MEEIAQRGLSPVDDWFDILRPGPAIRGRDHALATWTEQDLRRLARRMGSPKMVYNGHPSMDDSRPVAVFFVRFETETQVLQARMMAVDVKFRRALERGELFGRSVSIGANGNIEHLAFCGTDAIPGCQGNRPQHFLNPAAFADEESYLETKYIIEVDYAAWAERQWEESARAALAAADLAQKQPLHGNYYFRTDNGYVYQKTGPTTWTFRRDITGPQGKPGRDGTDATVPPNTFFDQVAVTYIPNDPGPEPGQATSPRHWEVRDVVASDESSGTNKRLRLTISRTRVYTGPIR